MKNNRGGNVKGRDTDTERNRENSRLKENNACGRVRAHTHTHTQIYDVQNVQLFQTNNSNFVTCITKKLFLQQKLCLAEFILE